MASRKFIRINVAFLPPPHVARAAIFLSQKIARGREYYFALDGKNFYPHITIYSPEYPRQNLPKIFDAVTEIAQETKPVKFTVHAIKEYEDFIGLDFDLTPPIKSLHQKVVEVLNPWREGHIDAKYDRDSEYYQILDKQQKNNVAAYGYPDCLRLYKPHLTIIRLHDEKTAAGQARDARWHLSRFVADKIACYRMGEHGTCIELVQEFSLS